MKTLGLGDPRYYIVKKQYGKLNVPARGSSPALHPGQ